LQVQGNSPAGFVFYASLRSNNAPVQEIRSDASWLASSTASAGWERPGFAANDWKPSAEIADATSGPWNTSNKLGAALGRLIYDRPVRAALVKADTLAIALGRPNREVAVTMRPSAATTLQALELTNGRTLALYLQQGAKRALAESQNPREIASRLWVRALGRVPTDKEMADALALIGNPAKPEGVEDLLWVLAMLPEFQLVY
jgi:hypothetical protein